MYGKAKGQKAHSRAIEIDVKKLGSLLHASTSENVLVEVELMDAQGNKLDSHLALLSDVQHHPVKDYIIHIDLHEIAQDELLHAEVPIVSTGEPIGVKSGGLLETMMRTIRVACLPRNLPDSLTADVSGLQIGESIHVRELTLPEGVTPTNPPELPIFTVFAPKEETTEVATPGEVKQPEVIKEKKVDENAAPDAKGGKDAKKSEGKK